MEHLWQILSGASWWVYVLLIIFVRLGIQSMRPRVITLQRMILFPLFFIVWSVYRLYQNNGLEFPSLIVWWALCLIFGSYLGVKEVRSWKVHVDKEKRTITIPGNYSTIVLILAIFILNFFWGYFYATLANIPYWIYLADTITTTIFTGFFVGRGGFFLKRYLSHR